MDAPVLDAYGDIDVVQAKDIQSRNLWTAYRCKDLAAAITRYQDAGKPVPPEWTRELHEHVERLWHNEPDKAEGGV